MSDLIKREDVLNVLRAFGWTPIDGLYLVVKQDIQSADRPQGEWKPFDLTWGRSIWYCTACEESTEVPCDIWTHKPIYKYCPNCGADMRGDNDGKDIQSAGE